MDNSDNSDIIEAKRMKFENDVADAKIEESESGEGVIVEESQGEDEGEGAGEEGEEEECEGEEEENDEEEKEEEEEVRETKWEYSRRVCRESIGKALAKKWNVGQVSERELTLYVKFKTQESQSLYYKREDDEDTEMLLDCCEELGLSRHNHQIGTILSFATLYEPRTEGKCVCM
jgi:hypothetical protein